MEFIVREYHEGSFSRFYAVRADVSADGSNALYLRKDGSIHPNTGFLQCGEDPDKTPGFWATREEAEQFVARADLAVVKGD